MTLKTKESDIINRLQTGSDDVHKTIRLLAIRDNKGQAAVNHYANHCTETAEHVTAQ